MIAAVRIQPFRKGDRVRLTAKTAQMAMHGYSGLTRKHCDWIMREGTVHATPLSSSGGVTIMWDGRTGHDHWPKRAIEHVDDQSVRRTERAG
jgi:hypothetical protein